MPIRLLIITMLLIASSGTLAFACEPTGEQECRLDLSTATIIFSSGINSFSGETQFQGIDGNLNGYAMGSSAFPDLTVIDTSGSSVGFSFAPPMYGQVGGSGIEGYHEASAYFNFFGMQFFAKPGYRVDGVELSVSGSTTTVGNGYAALTVPGVPNFIGDQFTGSAVLDPLSAQNFGAGFLISTYYEEGEDGTAAAFGTASAAITSASLIVHVSAVPEPSTYVLLLLGLGMVCWSTPRGRCLHSDS